MNSLIEKFLRNFLFRSFSLVLGLVLNIIVARQFSKNDAGDYFFFIQVLLLLSVAVRYGSDNALLKYSQYVSNVSKILKTSLKYGLIIFIAILLGLLGLNLLDSGFLSNTNQIIFISCLLPYSFVMYVSEYIRGRNKQNLAVFLQLTMIPIVTLLLIWLSVGYSLIEIYFFSITITFLVSIYIFKKISSLPIPNDKILKDNICLKYKDELFVFFVISLMAALMSTLDTIMLGVLASNIEVAEYSLANKLATLPAIILIIINGIIGPKFSALWRNGKNQEIINLFFHITKYLAIIGGLILILCLLFGELMIVYLFGVDYLPSVSTFYIISVSQFIVLSTGPVAYLLMMTNSQKAHRNSIFIAVLINLLLNAILIPLYGALGAAIGTSFSIVFKNVYSLAIVKKKFIFKEIKQHE